RCSKEQVRRRPKRLLEQDIAFTSCEWDLFEQHAPEMFRKLIGVEYPRFSRFEVNPTGFRCFFLNGPDDRNPSSFCEGNRNWLVRLLDTRDDPNTHVLIRGPQGCGKSTKIMQSIPEIYERDRGVIFFSSPSIAQAQEKVETFARVNQDERFVQFLYLSLTAL